MNHRCSLESVEADEPLLGSAPVATQWLFVEWDHSWGRSALRNSHLPDDVCAWLVDRPERVQLIRRHGRSTSTGHRLFRWDADTGDLTTAQIDDLAEVMTEPAFTAYDEPLWLVCTNGSHDMCCAEFGRPVAAALQARWPEATWETTHLGGHRFSATLLALPSGITLGRLNPVSAVAACADIAGGAVPDAAHLRGRAGRPGPTQVAEHYADAWGVAPEMVVVTSTPGPVVHLSCGDDQTDQSVRYAVTRSSDTAS